MNPPDLGLFSKPLTKSITTSGAFGRRLRHGRHNRGAKALGFAILALLVAAWASTPHRVSAHAVLVRSDPAANAKLPSSPKVVSIYFSEPLEPKFSNAKVVDPAGVSQNEDASRVDAGDATHLNVDVKPLKPGFYSVLWTTVSKVDGHKLQGSYPFIVLNADGSLPAGSEGPSTTSASSTGGTASNGPVDVVAYWLAILGAVAVFGTAVFALVIGLPAVASTGIGDLSKVTLAVERRLLWLALAAFAVGELLLLALQVFRLGGFSALSQVLGTSYGEYWLARFVLAGLVAACVLLLGLTSDPSARAPLLSLAGLCGFGVLACMSLTSHGAAIGNGWFWATIGDLLHLSMVGLWVGGLLSLVMLLWFAGPTAPAAVRYRYDAALVSRFSPLAAAAVTLILASGAFSAVVEVPSLSGLIHTGYGRSLLLKLALVLPLLAVAGLNAFILRPRFVGNRTGLERGDQKREAEALRILRRTVLLEGAFGVLVLLAVGLLLIAPPARDFSGQTPQAAAAAASGSSVYNNTSTAGDLAIHLTVDPNKVGLNTYQVKLSDAQGPVADASLVRLDLNFADPKFGTSNILLPSQGDGTYAAQGANFSQVGRWGVTVVVRRPGKDDALSSFTVEVPDASGNLTISRVGQVDAFASPSRLFTSDQLGGIGLALAGLLPLVLRRQLWNMGAIAGAAGTFGGLAGLILGGTLFFAAHQEGTTDYTLLPNPVPVTNESVAAGKQLYLQNCAVCHGQTGHGDGPAAQALNPKPFDLTVHVGLHADGVLWGWITYGIPRTAMPAWKDKLTDAQRWQLVDFMRTDFQASAGLPDENAALPPAGTDRSPKLAAAAAWAAALDSGAANGNP